MAKNKQISNEKITSIPAKALKCLECVDFGNEKKKKKYRVGWYEAGLSFRIISSTRDKIKLSATVFEFTFYLPCETVFLFPYRHTIFRLRQCTFFLFVHWWNVGSLNAIKNIVVFFFVVFCKSIRKFDKHKGKMPATHFVTWIFRSWLDFSTQFQKSCAPFFICRRTLMVATPERVCVCVCVWVGCALIPLVNMSTVNYCNFMQMTMPLSKQLI